MTCRAFFTCETRVTPYWEKPHDMTFPNIDLKRPISVYRFTRGALTLCPPLCMGIQPGARLSAPSADALFATLYGHVTQAIYRNLPIEERQASCNSALPGGDRTAEPEDVQHAVEAAPTSTTWVRRRRSTL